MEPIVERIPTTIGDISIAVLEPTDAGEPKRARFSIQVLDQNGEVVNDWQRQGDLVPYLDDASTYLATADRVTLVDLLNRIRQEASLRILGA